MKTKKQISIQSSIQVIMGYKVIYPIALNYKKTTKMNKLKLSFFVSKGHYLSRSSMSRRPLKENIHQIPSKLILCTSKEDFCSSHQLLRLNFITYLHEAPIKVKNKVHTIIIFLPNLSARIESKTSPTMLPINSDETIESLTYLLSQ